ncbi:MAG: M48 family metalloprotease [Nitrospinae bacterium]|nr:M48 family metalloprotease [Nitrospinota bacterium]
MKKFNLRPLAGIFAVGLALLLAGPADSQDWGSIIMKGLEKKDAIIKTATALRKGFSELTEEEEYYIGRSVAAKILSQYKPVDDKRRTGYINTLGQTLARFSTQPETFGGYHFMLINSGEINAFAAPGGFIFITTGLYSRVKSEEQLAAVLAHEISHVTLKHGLSAIKSSRLTEAFTIIGTEAVKEYSSAEVAQLTAAFEGTIDDIVNKMVVNGYSRSQEFEADEEALKTTWKAGYNPAGLAQFLATLAEEAKGAGETGFYKTHPPAADRLASCEKLIKKNKYEAVDEPAREQRFKAFAAK